MSIYDVMEEDMHSDDGYSYSHSDHPLPDSETFDSWAEDTPVVRPLSDVPLPRWLTDLRDGTDVANATAGTARQQRLAQMERDIADLADFIADCDRYAEFMNALESPCVSPHVPRLMGIHLQERRQQAVLKGRRLRSELAILRRQG